jgi:hypothetical protein
MTGTASALNGAHIGLNKAVKDRNGSVAGSGLLEKVKAFLNNSPVAGGVSYYAAKRELNRTVGSQLAQRA